MDLSGAYCYSSPVSSCDWKHLLEMDLGLSDMEDSAGVTPPVLNPAQKVGPEIYDESYNVEDFLWGNAATQPDPNRAEGMGHSAAADMEIAQPEFNSLVEEVNAGLPQPAAGSYPAGDAGTSTATSMEIPHLVDAQPPEFDSLKANAGATQPADPYFVGDMDPSTSTNNEIIHRLQAMYEHHKKERNFGHVLYEESNVRRTNADLAESDPWDLPAAQRCYITKSSLWCPVDEKTHQGYWKEKEAMFIRTTPFTGLKRTLEFHMKDNTATKWFMHEYSLLESLGTYRQCIWEDFVFRKVFKDDKVGVFCPPRKMANNGEPDDKLNRKNISHSDCSHPYAVQNDQAPSGKRPRTHDPESTKESHVWQHFTRIYVKVPTEAGSKKKDCYKLVYAACHHCDRVFKASTKNGTSHLGRHADACKCNHSQPTSS